MHSAMQFRTAAAALAVVALAAAAKLRLSSSTASGTHAENINAAAPTGGNPYHILGVANDADKSTVIKAYRALAMKWHPDRNRADPAAADAAFAIISHAYDVLTDVEKREVYDRLGEDGLARLRDGDPSVKKDWLPPDEVLRRIHNDGDEPWLQSFVTSSFSRLGQLWSVWEDALPTLRGLGGMLGVTFQPSVVITATEDASGATLSSGGTTSGDVTFKFALSGRSFDFDATDVSHNCARAKFLGMKTTFYLQCAHTQGAALDVSVAANSFTVRGKEGGNTPARFELRMV